MSVFSFNNFCIKAMVNSTYNCNKRKGNTSLYEIWLIIMKEIVTMTTIGICELSSPSSKFFGVRSKFPDVSLFRPNSFIEDYLRARRCHFTVKPTKESLSWKCFIELLVIFYATWVTQSYIVLLISSEQLDNHIPWGPQLTIVWLAININSSDFGNPDFGFWSLLIPCSCLTVYLFPFSGIWEPSLRGKGAMTALAFSGCTGASWGFGFPLSALCQGAITEGDESPWND